MKEPMTTHPAPVSKKALWTGYIMSALPVLLLLFSASMKLLKPPAVVQGFTQFGFPESLILKLGILELTCTILYLIPRTSVLGAILLTGYLGGATVTHVRAGQAFFIPVLAGVLVWGGLFLRDPRVRELIPVRR
jgi:hypothetical protein